MRDRRNEVVLHALGAVDLVGHIVDRVAQLADLVVIGLLQAHAVASCRDLLGDVVDLEHRVYDRPDKVAVGRDDEDQEHQTREQRHADDDPDLALDHTQRADEAHAADQIAARGQQRRGDAHHALVRERIASGEHRGLLRGERLCGVLCGRQTAAGQTGCREQDTPVRVEKLLLELVLLAERCHSGLRLRVELVIGIGEVFAEGVRGRDRARDQIVAHGGVVIARHADRDQNHHGRQNDKHE